MTRSPYNMQSRRAPREPQQLGSEIFSAFSHYLNIYFLPSKDFILSEIQVIFIQEIHLGHAHVQSKLGSGIFYILHNTCF